MSDIQSQTQRLISEPVGRRILTADQIDDLAEAVIMLVREVHVVADRLLVLEEVLANNGIDVSQVDTHQPSDALQARIDAVRDNALTNVMRALRVSG